MARTRYGKTFRTSKGRVGRYKYVNGRRVAFLGKNFYPKRTYYRKYRRGRTSGRRTSYIALRRNNFRRY